MWCSEALGALAGFFSFRVRYLHYVPLLIIFPCAACNCILDVLLLNVDDLGTKITMDPPRIELGTLA